MRKKGNFKFPINFEPTGQSILDARLTVSTKNDLITGYTDGNYYPKMVVTVEDEQALYMLIGDSPTQLENWKRIDVGQAAQIIDSLRSALTWNVIQ